MRTLQLISEESMHFRADSLQSEIRDFLAKVAENQSGYDFALHSNPFWELHGRSSGYFLIGVISYEEHENNCIELRKAFNL